MIAGSSYETTARILTISGVVTIVAGIVLGLVMEPYLFLIALVGVVDVVVARVIAGRPSRGAT